MAQLVSKAAGCLIAVGCGGDLDLPSSELGRSAQALTEDPPAVSAPADDGAPATDYTLFEAGPVRPVAVLRESGIVAVTNTVDDFLELLAPRRKGVVERCGAVQVGMRPVAVAVVREAPGSAELWVVNHLSDSVSVVRIEPASCTGEVVRTLQVGDEPRDIVVARAAKTERVFVSTAHRGQHHPVASARNGHDLVTAPAQKAQRGLADVFVFDAQRPAAPPAVVNLFGDTPRALALGDGVVYGAVFHSGNRTTSIMAPTVGERGLRALEPLLARDESGGYIERDGELVLASGVRGRARMSGGNAAVSGAGRCVQDPRYTGNEVLQQLCVATDERSRVRNVFVQREGVVDARCQCTSGDGTLQPITAVIAQFFGDRRACGADFTTFPDGTRGCWLDAEPGGVHTPALGRARQSPPTSWNDALRFSLPDQDVFAIDVATLEPTRAFSGVGTILFNMAVQPGSGHVFVTNTDAENLTRFEGEGRSSSTSVIGHLHESRITIIDPGRGTVEPVHLNDHIDYGRCCERDAAENAASIAFPTGVAFSPDGERVFFTALGSDKVVLARAAAFTDRRSAELGSWRHGFTEVSLGASIDEPSGPVGLAFDAGRGVLYVKTHFSNELVVIDAEASVVTQRVTLPSPEPASITQGRSLLYNARLTSAHGDSACASCHVFGDLDSLAWDLGDPDAATVKNPGPFATPVELAFLRSIAIDPLGDDPNNRPQSADFRSHKGPMTTQTLRGLANHGAQHWRGDRTRRQQEEPGRQPDFGSLDEQSSFNEFDVAITGLNGNDRELEPDVFQRLTTFALQLTQPPNPIRALDDGLTPAQAAGRALFFGCASMSDEQFGEKRCTAQDGSEVAVDAATQDCFCSINPLVGALKALPRVVGFATLLRGLFATPGLRDAVIALAGSTSGLPESEHARAAAVAQNLTGAIGQLAVADLALDAHGLLSFEAAGVLSGVSGNLLAVLQLSAAHKTRTGSTLLGLLAGSIPPGALPDNDPLRTPAGLQATITSTFTAANFAVRVAADELSRDTSAFRDLLGGCDVQQTYQCRLRTTDSFDSCHGCHTLDPSGNAEYAIDRPGFFGTSGGYSFEAESQMLKVPHLRNQYQKVGMFGMSPSTLMLPESVLGVGQGGFFAADTAYQGPQVRGVGFLHDGATDTIHRFHGAIVFSETAPGGGLAAPGSALGLPQAIPAVATRAACLERVRATPASTLEAMPASVRDVLPWCLSASAIPDGCFLEPLERSCREALDAIGVERGEPDFAGRFLEQIRPACFQLGSQLEGGSAAGPCFPQGLREREQLEAFMLAFDSNLKPIVGQQVTFTGSSSDTFEQVQAALIVSAASRLQCDAALRAGSTGYLVVAPRADAPLSSTLLDAAGAATSLGDVLAKASPATLTCYPPAPKLAEARREAFARVRPVTNPYGNRVARDVPVPLSSSE